MNMLMPIYMQYNENSKNHELITNDIRPIHPYIVKMSM